MYIVRLLRGEHLGDTDRFHDDRASAIRRANALVDLHSAPMWTEERHENVTVIVVDARSFYQEADQC